MSESDGGQKPKRMKKMKYRLIGEEWGEGADERSIDAPNILELWGAREQKAQG